VVSLDNSNGWQRDTAQRLLVERQDKQSVKPLEKLMVKSANPKARIQALCALDGIGGVTRESLVPVLGDSHPLVVDVDRIVRRCLRIAIASYLNKLGDMGARAYAKHCWLQAWRRCSISI